MNVCDQMKEVERNKDGRSLFPLFWELSEQVLVRACFDHNTLQKVLNKTWWEVSKVFYPDFDSLSFLKTCLKTSNNEHDWIPIKYLNVLHHNRTTSSCNNIAKILPTSYFGYFGNAWPLPSRRACKDQLVKTLTFMCMAKNDLHS